MKIRNTGWPLSTFATVALVYLGLIILGFCLGLKIVHH